MRYLIFILLYSASLWASPIDYWTNREGLREFKKENYTFAYNHFLKSLQNQNTSTARLINLGRSYEALKQFDYALSTYEKALQFAQTPQDRFASLFNLASVHGKKKNIDEALKYYQQALEIFPDSKEVKKNIELLIQQGQGNGQGESKDGQDPKEGEDGQDEKDSKDNGEERKVKTNKKYQMKPFKSDELNEHDVGKIFDELKQQEQNIRQNMNKQENPKESPSGKDW